VYINTTSTNSQQISNSKFINCRATSGSGGAIYLQSIPINISQCTFTTNIASSGLGNDIFLAASVSYPSHYIAASCSSSKTPTITTGTSDEY
jgi:hypothetical protein